MSKLWFPALLASASFLAAQPSTSQAIYFPKPVKPAPYVAPMKPVVRLAELKARHKGHANWTETVVADYYNRTDVISAAPGAKVPLHLHADSPEYWFIEEGAIRFEIDDPPGNPQNFDAPKGSLVFAPERMLHSLEVLGDQPAIRVQVTLREATPIYPTKPNDAPAGTQMIPATVWVNPDPSDVPSHGPDRLLFNLTEMLKGNPKRSWSNLAIEKNRAHANIICGYAADLKPTPGDRGHFHDFPETWVIMTGEQHFAIEGEAPFVAQVGDIAYAPSTRWHLPEPYGETQSCRLAMTPFPNGNHLYDLPAK
jgi:mannose-6-phosphate isomerase-like protein (cupin superfamily)